VIHKDFPLIVLPSASSCKTKTNFIATELLMTAHAPFDQPPATTSKQAFERP